MPMTTGTLPTTAQPWVPNDDSFAARLALIRHRMRWNVKEAARACGVPAASWRQWEFDEAQPRRFVEVAMKIASTVGCDVDWLIRGLRQPAGSIDRKASQRVLKTTGTLPARTPPRPQPQARRPMLLARA